MTNDPEGFDPIPTAEPVLISSLISSLVLAILGLAVTFGLHLTADQTGALVLVLGLLLKTGTAIWTRSKVTPVK